MRTTPEVTIIEFTKTILTDIFSWSDPNYWYAWAVVLFLSSMISLAPWRLPAEHNFLQIVTHLLRKAVFWAGVVLIAGFFLTWWFYWLVAVDNIDDYNKHFFNYFKGHLSEHWTLLASALFMGVAIRFYYFRFFHPYLSGLLRDWRNLQSDDQISDIRDERLKYTAKDYLPSKFYDGTKKKLVVGLDAEDKPIYIPLNVWRQTNTQIIGPTRYGKGVAVGCLMDQIIRLGDGLFYIDPKDDEWAPHVMLQAALATNRPFYHITLHDKGIGYWAPFLGGDRREAYARLVTIFGMVEGGGESDFYKIIEKMQLNRIVGKDDKYDLENLYGKITAFNSYQKNPRDKAIKVEALLENWRQIKSLNPPNNVETFSVEKALRENAVVYVQGSLVDDVVRTATKAFIMEVIQETMRLKKERTHHATLIVDEVSFLVSKQLRDALATVVGFNMNVVSMYQSPNDLKFPDDKTLDGNALLQSMNINSQIKLIYGGADYDTAKWVSELSGSITKNVTSFEKTNVRTAGAEEWERGRIIKTHEEATIPINVVLSLPPRVAILFQPHQLATATFTAPAKVNDTKVLPAWLQAEAKRLEKPAALPSPAPSPANNDDNKEASPAAELEHAQVDNAPVFNMDTIIEEGLLNTSRENLVWALGKKQRTILESRIPKDAFEKAVARLESLKNETPEKLEHAQVSASPVKNGPPPPKYDLEALLSQPKESWTTEQCIWLFKTPARQERVKDIFTEEEALKWKRLAMIRKGQAVKETPETQPAKEPAPMTARSADDMTMFESS